MRTTWISSGPTSVCSGSVPRSTSPLSSESSTSLAAWRNGLTNSTFMLAPGNLDLLDQAQVVEEVLDLLGGGAKTCRGVWLPCGLWARAASADRADRVRRGVGQKDHRRQRIGRQLVLMMEG